MRALLVGFMIAGATCAAIAQQAHVFRVPVGTAVNTTNTFAGKVGYIDEIHVSVSDGVDEAVVELALIPVDGKTAAINISTNTVTGSKVFRPRFDGTTVAGAANDTDPPERFLWTREQLRVVILGSTTQLTWNVTIKTDR